LLFSPRVLRILWARTRPECAGVSAGATAARRPSRATLGRLGCADDEAQYLVFLHDEEFLAVDLDLCAGILAEQDAIASLDVQREYLAVFVDLALAYGNHFALLRLLFGRVGDDDAATNRFLFLNPPDQNAVMQGSQLGGHSDALLS